MNDPSKANQELLEEISSLKKRIQELEKSDAEHKQEEKTLKENNDKFLSLASTIPGNIAYVNANPLQYEFVNDTFEKSFGIHREKIIGQHIKDIIGEANYKFAIKYIEEVRLGKSISYENTFDLVSGKRWIQVNYSPVTDANGLVVSIAVLSLDITERKKAEEALRKGEEILHEEQIFNKLLLDASPAYIVAISFDGKTLMMNKSLLEALEYTHEEIRGTNYITTFVPEKDRVGLAEVFQEIVRQGKSNVSENRIISKSGRIYNVEWHGRPVPREGKSSDFFVGIGIDITVRKQMEETLRKDEELYQAMFENTGSSIILIEDDMTISMANKEFVRNTGYSSDEIIGCMKWTEIIHPDDLERMIEQHRLRRGSQGGALPNYEFRYITKTGDLRDTLLTIKLIPGTKKSIASLIDITDRKKAEEALKNSEAKYRNIFENAVEGIYQSTIEGRFITVNAAFARMAGYDSPEELIESIRDIETQFYVHSEDRERFMRIMETDGFVDGFEVEFYKKDGSTFWVVINARTVKDEQGKIIYNEGLMEDITIRKHSEEQLHQTLDRLNKAVSTTIQVLVSAVEMRDPYTAGHQSRVAKIACAIATEMGLPQDKIEGIGMAGSIHDIGKLSIPAEILTKTTKLSNIEFLMIKEHSQSGYEMLKNVESPWPLAQIVYQHHERMNGTGYPRNLKGNEILMEARIMAVADVVEAMASHRPYRAAFGIEIVLEEIEKNKGIIYDADVADACLKLFREKGYQLK